MSDDGSMLCPSCGVPRRVFVVFEHKRGEYVVCVSCVGSDLTKRRPATPPGSTPS